MGKKFDQEEKALSARAVLYIGHRSSSLPPSPPCAFVRSLGLFPLFKLQPGDSISLRMHCECDRPRTPSWARVFNEQVPPNYTIEGIHSGWIP